MEIKPEDFKWLMDIAKHFLAWNPLNTVLKNYYEQIKKRYEKECKQLDV